MPTTGSWPAHPLRELSRDLLRARRPRVCPAETKNRTAETRSQKTPVRAGDGSVSPCAAAGRAAGGWALHGLYGFGQHRAIAVRALFVGWTDPPSQGPCGAGGSKGSVGRAGARHDAAGCVRNVERITHARGPIIWWLAFVAAGSFWRLVKRIARPVGRGRRSINNVGGMHKSREKGPHYM